MSVVKSILTNFTNEVLREQATTIFLVVTIIRFIENLLLTLGFILS